MSLTPLLAKGAQSAWHELALSQAPHLFYLCRLLTADEKTAHSAALQALRKGLKSLKEGRVSLERLDGECQRNAVVLCRDAIKTPSPFARKPDKSTPALPTEQKDTLLALALQLSSLSRFVLALSHLCGYSPKQTGQLLHLPASAVETQLALLPAVEADALNREGKAYPLSPREQNEVLALADEMRGSLWEKERKRKKKLCFTSCALVLAVCVCVGLIWGLGSLISTTFTSSGNHTEDAGPTDALYTRVTVDANKSYYADIRIRDYGTVTVKLDPKNAPITVSRFTQLAKEGFYNGLTFHRIIEGFMMQGGDPLGNGTGGSGVNILGEFDLNGVKNPLSHDRGVISMARANSYNSGDCQFFIVHEDTYKSSLDGKYAAFGQVTEGMDVVDRICKEATPTDNNGSILKSQQPVIESITIREE